MKRIKELISSINQTITNILLICMMFSFANCGPITIFDLFPELNYILQEESDISQDELMQLCSTSNPEINFNYKPEGKIYTLDSWASTANVTYCSSYTTNTITLGREQYSPYLSIDNNHSSMGDTYNFGVFRQSRTLNFHINVLETGYTFYTERDYGSDNPDGLVHAKVYEIKPNLFFIGFEDAFNGGDQDFNDMNFIVEIYDVSHIPAATTILNPTPP